MSSQIKVEGKLTQGVHEDSVTCTKATSQVETISGLGQGKANYLTGGDYIWARSR